MEFREAAKCEECNSTEFGIETWEDETGYIYDVYCKSCLQVFYTWGYPKPAAFGKE